MWDLTLDLHNTQRKNSVFSSTQGFQRRSYYPKQADVKQVFIAMVTLIKNEYT